MYEGCPKKAETNDVIKLIEYTGRLNLCQKEFQ